MNINDAFPSNYLKANDVPSDTVMVISHVDQETIGTGKDAEAKLILHFHGSKKGMVLNKTNANTITKLYGAETDDWRGKSITLYATEVEFQGETVMAIRIRLRAPGTAPAVSAATANNPKAAMATAWSEFQKANSDAANDKTVMAGRWQQAYKAFFGDTGRDSLTAQQWLDFIAAGFKSPVGDAPFAAAGAVDEDAIPF